MSSTTRCLVIVVLALVVAARPSHSNPAADSLFDEGKRLYGAAQSPAGFDSACAKFEASLKIDPDFLDARGYLALCYERAGRLATAWAEFRRVRSSAREKNLVKHLGVAESHILAIEPKLAKITIQVQATPPALTVKQDGTVVPPETFNSPLAIDRGDHVYLAEAPGFVSATQTITIADGELKTVVIPTLTPIAKNPDSRITTKPPGQSETTPLAPTTDPASPIPSTEAPIAESSTLGMSNKRKAAITVGSAGVVAVAVGLGFGWKARSQWNEAHSNGHCDANDVCDDTGFDLIDDAYGTARISTVVVGVGLAALGTSAYLWFTGASSPMETRATAFAPMVHRDLFGALVQGRF